MKHDPRQPDLFGPRPRNFDEQLLMRRLRDAARGRDTSVRVAGVGPMRRSAIRRLLTPLPKITVPGWS